MLIKISDLITPEIYEVIYRMGHLDELMIADASLDGIGYEQKGRIFLFAG